MLLEATATTAGVLAIGYKLDLKKVLNYDILIDCVVTGGLMYVYAGTYSGMVTAMVSGLLLSVSLIFLKRAIGYKRPTRRGTSILWEECRV